MRSSARLLLPAVPVALALLLHACAYLAPPPGVGRAVDWDRLPGWSADRHAEAWPALLAQCARLPAKEPAWAPVCAAAGALADPDDRAARRFFEAWFVPHRLNGSRGRREGLITGYYQPLLDGSRVPTARYRFPLYRPPADLLTVDLGELYPELKNKRVRGRLEGRTVLPYPGREDIEGPGRPLAGNELLWVDDPVALFFLHIQGSGRVRLTDGSVTAVGYADQNGRPYVSIGRTLVEMGELELEQVTLFSIRDWLKDHPERAQAVLFSNPSYVFFRERPAADAGPLGSLNVPLAAERSLAVDPTVVPLGSPVWLDTRLPGDQDGPYRRLVFAQDTGGAIQGPLRADLYFGLGQRAERLAGTMKQAGRLYVLLPLPAPQGPQKVARAHPQVLRDAP